MDQKEGCWVLKEGCWVLGTGRWVLGAGCWPESVHVRFLAFIIYVTLGSRCLAKVIVVSLRTVGRPISVPDKIGIPYVL
jgi:hypothetical protein